MTYLTSGRNCSRLTICDYFFIRKIPVTRRSKGGNDGSSVNDSETASLEVRLVLQIGGADASEGASLVLTKWTHQVDLSEMTSLPR
jgi:hypothetical protein